MIPENEIEEHCKGCKHIENDETEGPCKDCKEGSLWDSGKPVLPNMSVETLMLWSFFTGAILFGIGGFFIGLLF